MAVIYTIALVIGAVCLYWAWGYAHEWVYAKWVRKSMPRSKEEHLPLLVRGYIWGLGYMVVSMFFFA